MATGKISQEHNILALVCSYGIQREISMCNNTLKDSLNMEINTVGENTPLLLQHDSHGPPGAQKYAHFTPQKQQVSRDFKSPLASPASTPFPVLDVYHFLSIVQLLLMAS